MSLDSFPVKSNEGEAKVHLVTYQGAGAAVMTVDNGGTGMTLTRDGAGVYTITWADNPGNFLGMGLSVGAAAEAGVDGFSVVREAYVPATKSIQLNINDELFAAHDLSADEFLDLQFWFQSTGA